MIKGRKIESSMLKINVPVKNGEIEGIKEIQKCFRPEKVEIFQKRMEKQKQNVNDATLEESCSNKKAQIFYQTVQLRVQAKAHESINEKGKQTGDLKEKNGCKKIQQIKNRSLDRQFSIKLAKNIDEKQMKPFKQIIKTKTAISKNTANQISSKIKKATTNAKKAEISKNNLENNLGLTNCQLQLQQESQTQIEQIEQERVYPPNPIQLDILKLIQPKIPQTTTDEISFRNKDFEVVNSQYLLDYENSDSESEHISFKVQPIRCATDSEDFKCLSQQFLQINSELFQLSTEELLAKDYFNI